MLRADGLQQEQLREIRGHVAAYYSCQTSSCNTALYAAFNNKYFLMVFVTFDI